MDTQEKINKKNKVKNKKRARIISPKKKIGRTRINKERNKDEIEAEVEKLLKMQMQKSENRSVSRRKSPRMVLSPKKNMDRRKTQRLVMSPSSYSTIKTKRKKVRGKTKNRVLKKSTSLGGDEGGTTATTSKSIVEKETDESNINAIILQNIKAIMNTQSILLKKIANIEEDIRNMKIRTLEK